jgi:hypothetical protein
MGGILPLCNRLLPILFGSERRDCPGRAQNRYGTGVLVIPGMRAEPARQEGQGLNRLIRTGTGTRAEPVRRGYSGSLVSASTHQGHLHLHLHHLSASYSGAGFTGPGV